MAGVRREVEAAVRGEFADYRWAEELAGAPLEVTR
jgi:hypothetical protein